MGMHRTVWRWRKLRKLGWLRSGREMPLTSDSAKCGCFIIYSSRLDFSGAPPAVQQWVPRPLDLFQMESPGSKAIFPQRGLHCPAQAGYPCRLVSWGWREESHCDPVWHITQVLQNTPPNGQGPMGDFSPQKPNTEGDTFTPQSHDAHRCIKIALIYVDRRRILQKCD